MALRVDRSGFDPEDGFTFYVAFKPHMELGTETLTTRMPVEAAVSLSETGELADVAFVVPKPCRNDQALSFIHKQNESNYIEPRVFIAIVGTNGDAVVNAAAKLDIDPAGRIVGMEIEFHPIAGCAQA